MLFMVKNPHQAGSLDADGLVRIIIWRLFFGQLNRRVVALASATPLPRVVRGPRFRAALPNKKATR
jgi:hypothetical protein